MTSPTLLAKLSVEEVPSKVAHMTTASKLYVVRPLVPIQHIVALRSNGTMWCTMCLVDDCAGCQVVDEHHEQRDQMGREDECGCDTGCERCES